MTSPAFEQTAVFQRLRLERYFFLFLTLFLDLLVLYALACLQISEEGSGKQILGFNIYFEPFSWTTALYLSLLVGGQFLLGHWAMRSVLSDTSVTQLYPEDQSKGQSYGPLTGPELVAMVRELCTQMGVPQPTRILLQKEPIPNAYTGRILFMGNIVVLHSNLLEILPRDEVKAIVAHEVAHIRRWDSFINQLANLPRGFRFFLQAILFFKVIEGLWSPAGISQFFARLFFLYLGWHLLGFIFGLIERVANTAMQRAELLADGYAAQMVGAEPTINALLRVGQRSEALMALMESLGPWYQRLGRELDQSELMRILNRFPPAEMREKVARETAAEVLVRDQLLVLKEHLLLPLTDEQIDELARKANAALQAEEASKPAEERMPQPDHSQDERLVDWHKFDFDNSNDLDRRELARLVEVLRSRPDRMLFRQFLQAESEWQSHPTMRGRLLFLYETFIEQSAVRTTG